MNFRNKIKCNKKLITKPRVFHVNSQLYFILIFITFSLNLKQKKTTQISFRKLKNKKLLCIIYNF